MSITVSTTQFEFSHGKKPRGTGLWAFDIEGWPVPYFAPTELTYAQAKQHAIAHARSLGFKYARIEVLP